MCGLIWLFVNRVEVVIVHTDDGVVLESRRYRAYPV